MVVHGMFPSPMLNASQGSVRILWLYWPPRTGFKTWLSSRNTNIYVAKDLVLIQQFFQEKDMLS